MIRFQDRSVYIRVIGWPIYGTYKNIEEAEILEYREIPASHHLQWRRCCGRAENWNFISLNKPLNNPEPLLKRFRSSFWKIEPKCEPWREWNTYWSYPQNVSRFSTVEVLFVGGLLHLINSAYTIVFRLNHTKNMNKKSKIYGHILT